jgi:hypothetical protein
MAKRKDNPNETPEQAEARRLAQNIRKKLSREKAKGELPGTEDQSLTERKAKLTVTSTWKLNYCQLPKDEKAKLDAHIRRWDSINILMNDAIQVLDQKELTQDDREYLADIAADVDAFVAEFPPTKDHYYQALQNRDVQSYAELQPKLASLPPMFKRYGVPCDHVMTPIYSHLVSKIKDGKGTSRTPLPTDVNNLKLTSREQESIAHESWVQSRETP